MVEGQQVASDMVDALHLPLVLLQHTSAVK